MKNAPPPTLIAIAALYFLSEIAFMLSGISPAGLVRMALYTVVFVFVFRGSRTAANLWGFMSVLGGVVSAFGVLRSFQSNPDGALFLALYAAFFFAGAGYMFFSPGLRSFNDRANAMRVNPPVHPTASGGG